MGSAVPLLGPHHRRLKSELALIRPLLGHKSRQEEITRPDAGIAMHLQRG